MTSETKPINQRRCLLVISSAPATTMRSLAVSAAEISVIICYFYTAYSCTDAVAAVAAAAAVDDDDGCSLMAPVSYSSHFMISVSGFK